MKLEKSLIGTYLVTKNGEIQYESYNKLECIQYMKSVVIANIVYLKLEDLKRLKVEISVDIIKGIYDNFISQIELGQTYYREFLGDLVILGDIRAINTLKDLIKLNVLYKG